MLWQLAARRALFAWFRLRQWNDVVFTIGTVHAWRMLFELRWFGQFFREHWRVFRLFNRLKLRRMLAGTQIHCIRCTKQTNRNRYSITFTEFLFIFRKIVYSSTVSSFIITIVEYIRWIDLNLPSSSSSPPSRPIFLANNNCVSRSNSRISSMFMPYHSSCHIHACRCAPTCGLSKKERRFIQLLDRLFVRLFLCLFVDSFSFRIFRIPKLMRERDKKTKQQKYKS